MPESKADTSPPESLPPVKKSRWRWVRRFFLCVIILIGGLIVALNGPLGRWIIKDQAQKVTQKQGFEGGFQVNGTLLSGYTFSNIRYTSDAGISLAEVGKLHVGYNVRGLLNKKIEVVELETVKVKVDLAKFPESEKADKKPKDAKKSSDSLAMLNTIRSWVISPDIHISDLDVEIVKADNPVAAFQWESFKHLTESAEFNIDKFAAQNADRLDTEPQDIKLRWLEMGRL